MIQSSYQSRLDYLTLLQDGWHDGHGLAVTPDAITAAGCWLTVLPPIDDGYHIYPTDAGGILIEFILDRMDYSIDIASDGSAEISGVSIDE